MACASCTDPRANFTLWITPAHYFQGSPAGGGNYTINLCKECKDDIYADRNDKYWICHECDRAGVTTETIQYRKSRRNTFYCTHCFSNKFNIVPVLRDYNADVVEICDPVLKKNILYSGVELEVVADRSRISDVFNSLGLDYCITKKDSSISNGFEIVTIPATLEQHTIKFEKFLTDGISQISTDDSCGMHVHMTKKVIPGSSLLKMQFFMNACFNREFMDKVAGRVSETYAVLTPPKNGWRDFLDRRQVNKLKVSERYVGLNTRKPSTVEFRIFKSTLDYPTFISNIEFCYALVDFCNKTPINRFHLNFINFLDYLKDSPFTFLKKRLCV
jgi:hypothetical protein